MHWHAESITVTLRGFKDGDSYENRDKFPVVATAQLLGGKRAFISAFLRDGTQIHRIEKADWLALGVMLREQFGIEKIETERHTKPKTFATGPAPLS
ncbi:hypothetical protein RD110_08160 [Rhodoferax koreense]|uniref:Uncharacterized protein n=1 Tax=Rhodoferax koreensis TaxID=1842727 RepID=A0A1P8JTU8_9BURK|nr:hypothetical protein [Rhodoferax koreense]APW37177.1 hypothetical protein RD110_08160 [Rhodoferax koreense]